MTAAEALSVLPTATPAACQAPSLADGRDRFGRSWKDRRVTVVGLGRSGMAAAVLLRRVGACVRVTEVRETDAAKAARAALLAGGVEDVELGGHTPSFCEPADVVVVSPGVPEASGPIQWALARRLPLLSEVELAFLFCPSPLIAVTGTNGKSTVVTLIAQALAATGRAAIACGNLGIPFASVIEQLTPQHLAVVEVSSFQLLWCHQFRPRIGVLLNVGTNHLDRHQDHEAYFTAKARLFQRQTAEDWVVLNGRDPALAELGGHLAARCVWFGDNRDNPPAFRVDPLTQRVLTDNLQAVLQAGRILGLSDLVVWQTIRAFRGLEHRQEHVATVRGVRFINDSKSTTPESLLFALTRLSGNLVVIIGGRDKGLDFRRMADALQREPRVIGVVLIGESRARLRGLFNGSPPVTEHATLEEAVETATRLAGAGATVLFSPACASFDMFRDFEARGRAFKAIVYRLAEEAGSRP